MDRSNGGSVTEDQRKGGEHGTNMVTITVNGAPVLIHRGRQTVAQIKTLGHVPLADDLEQQIDKKLVPLADDGALTIKGEEVFVSHPKDSASSHDALFDALTLRVTVEA